jgi:hypothetical protein
LKIFLVVISFGVWIFSSLATAQDLKATDSAVSVLHSAQPNVNWDHKSAVTADLTCDGKDDVAIVGYENSEAVWLGVVSGNSNAKDVKPVTMKFWVGKHSQDSFCSTPVKLETHPLDCEGDEGEKLPGCKVVKGCFDLSMNDGNCDAFNFYWDSKKKRLAWWRR